MAVAALVGIITASCLSATEPGGIVRPPFKVDAKALVLRTQRLHGSPTWPEGDAQGGAGARVFRGEKATVLEWYLSEGRLPVYRVSADGGRVGWVAIDDLVAAASVKIATTLERVPTFDRPDAGAERGSGGIVPADLLFVLRRSGEFSEVDGSGGARGWVRTATLRIAEVDREILHLLMVRAGSDDPAAVARIDRAIRAERSGNPLADLVRGGPAPTPPPPPAPRPPAPLTPEEAVLQRRFGGPAPREVLLVFSAGIAEVPYSIQLADLTIAEEPVAEQGVAAEGIIRRNFIGDSGVWMSVAATTGAGTSLPPGDRPDLAIFKDARRASWARLPDGTLMWIEHLDQVSSRFDVRDRWAAGVFRGSLARTRYIEVRLDGD